MIEFLIKTELKVKITKVVIRRRNDTLLTSTEDFYWI